VNPKDYNSFMAVMREKLMMHSLFLEIQKQGELSLSQNAVIQIMQSLFRGYEFSSKTWRSYTQNMILWFRTVGVPLKAKIAYTPKGKGSRTLRSVTDSELNNIL